MISSLSQCGGVLLAIEWEGSRTVVSLFLSLVVLFSSHTRWVGSLCILQNREGGERRKGAGGDLQDWCCPRHRLGLTVSPSSSAVLHGCFAAGPSLFPGGHQHLAPWEACVPLMVPAWFLPHSLSLTAHLLSQFCVTGNFHTSFCLTTWAKQATFNVTSPAPPSVQQSLALYISQDESDINMLSSPCSGNVPQAF